MDYKNRNITLRFLKEAGLFTQFEDYLRKNHHLAGRPGAEWFGCNPPGRILGRIGFTDFLKQQHNIRLKCPISISYRAYLFLNEISEELSSNDVLSVLKNGFIKYDMSTHTIKLGITNELV